MRRLIAIPVWTAIGLLTTIVLVFAAIRIVTDTLQILTGEMPAPDAFEVHYVRYPILAYSHIVPGVVFLLLAPLQLSRRFRSRHLMAHRRLGRLALVAGLTSGVFALGFGIPFPTGGAWQAAATAVFGCYFLVALTVAYGAVRRRDIRAHRRWMIRAFSTGLAVGTIRIWVGLLSGLGPLAMEEGFAPAFWLAFAMHAIAAEAWLRWRPDARGGRPPRVVPQRRG